ncbi:MAG: flavodoxin domain-containing protein [Patescibacteria group bacterium]
MRKAIFYFSKWGATKQYADWIAEAVPGTDVIDAINGKPDPSPYGAIIIATRAYMGRIAAASYLARNRETLKSKKVYLLVVGMSPQDADDSKMQYNSIPVEIRNALQGYAKVPGAIDLDKLGFIVKKMFKMFSKGAPKSENQAAKEHIAPVIEWLKKIIN